MKEIKESKYVLAQSPKGFITRVGEEVRLDLKLRLHDNNNIDGGKIHGRVTTTDDTSIQGALVKLMSPSYDPIISTVTNRLGEYFFSNLKEGSYNIFAISNGTKLKQGNQFYINNNEDLTIDFILEEDPFIDRGIIVGDVINSTTNAPISGAVASLYFKSSDNTETLKNVTYTNEYGQYTFREVEKGSYSVKISSLGYNTQVTNSSVTEGGQIVSMNVSLTPNVTTSRGTISGIITDSQNQPLNRVDVILYKVNNDTTLTPIAFTKTNENGIYLFTNVEYGTYKIKSNQIDNITIDVPDGLIFAPNFAGFNLFFTENYIVNRYRASNGTLESGASIDPHTGFVQGLGGINKGYVTLDIDVPYSGTYNLVIEYLTISPKILSVLANKEVLSVMCNISGDDASSSKLRYVPVSLNKGINKIKFFNEFLISTPRIDLIDVEILPYLKVYEPSLGILENGATVNEDNFILGIGGPENGSVTFKINTPIDGSYFLNIKYVNPQDENTLMKISIDGITIINNMFFPTPTEFTKDSVYQAINLGYLVAGEHTIKYYNDTGFKSIIPGESRLSSIVPIELTFAQLGVLENGANILENGYVYKIGGINKGSVTINVNIIDAGSYSLGIQYINSTSMLNYMKISVNGEIGKRYFFPETDSDFEKDAKIYYMNINLNKGNNTIKFYNNDNVSVQSPLINKILIQKILLYKSYNVNDPNVRLINGAFIQDGLIKNVGYGLGEVILNYNDMPFPGLYFLEMLYVTTSSDRNCSIDVNNISTDKKYTFETTGSSDILNAKVKKVPVTFIEGANNIRIYTKNINSYREFTNIEIAKIWGDNEFLDYHLTTTEENTLEAYTKNANVINGPLRENEGNTNGLPLDILKQIEIIDTAFSKMRTPENIMLFRGDDTGYLGDEFKNTILNPDGTINEVVFEQVKLKFKGKDRTEFGYISTSLINGSAFAGRPILTEFKVLDDTKAGYIEPISYYKGQLEVLLPRNTTYIISDMIISSNKRQIIITALVKK